MKENLKNSSLEEIDDFFSSAPTANQKAWKLVNEFYHLLLTYMENNKISKSDLAGRLGKSRSSITQLFNKTPNISVKRMVEIADAIGLEIAITSKQIGDYSNIDKSDKTSKLNLVLLHNAWLDTTSDFDVKDFGRDIDSYMPCHAISRSMQINTSTNAYGTSKN